MSPLFCSPILTIFTILDVPIRDAPRLMKSSASAIEEIPPAALISVPFVIFIFSSSVRRHVSIITFKILPLQESLIALISARRSSYVGCGNTNRSGFIFHTVISNCFNIRPCCALSKQGVVNLRKNIFDFHFKFLS